MRRCCLFIAIPAIACQPIAPGSDSGQLRFESEDPLLTGLRLSCDTTAGRWTVDLRADAWVGTARLWMASSSEVVEQHELEVKRSAADASWDCFDGTIPYARDLGSPGSGTRFRCSTRNDLHMLIAVSDAPSTRWTDCLRWGPDGTPPWSEDVSIPDCPNTLDEAFSEDSYELSHGDVSACD